MLKRGGYCTKQESRVYQYTKQKVLIKTFQFFPKFEILFYSSGTIILRFFLNTLTVNFLAGAAGSPSI